MPNAMVRETVTEMAQHDPTRAGCEPNVVVHETVTQLAQHDPSRDGCESKVADPMTSHALARSPGIMEVDLTTSPCDIPTRDGSESKVQETPPQLLLHNLTRAGCEPDVVVPETFTELDQHNPTRAGYVGLKKQRQFCITCDNELGPDDPMPCFPEADNSRECMSCLMEYEQEMFEEYALASSDS